MSRKKKTESTEEELERLTAPDSEIAKLEDAEDPPETVGLDRIILPFSPEDVVAAARAEEAVAEASTAIAPGQVAKAIEEWNRPPEVSAPSITTERRGGVHDFGDAAEREERYARQAADNARWLEVDTDRMTGKVPHLADGGLGDNPTIMVNEQITSCPFFDPADGLWGGVAVGDTVAHYAPNAIAYSVATVLELGTDATATLFVMPPRDPAFRARVPHQSQRKPGGACWAHRTEEWTNVGRVAAEVKLGLGGSAYEDEKAERDFEEARRLRDDEEATAERVRVAKLANGGEV